MSFVFFWKPDGPNGFLGNWFSSPFSDEVGHHFLTNEHYMMWRKALLMGDADIAGRVLQTKSPNYARQLGRKVKGPNGWDEDLWLAHREQIMVDGLTHKFQQNPQLLDMLQATADKMLVEASPRDKIWGIGLNASSPLATQP